MGAQQADQHLPGGVGIRLAPPMVPVFGLDPAQHARAVLGECARRAQGG